MTDIVNLSEVTITARAAQRIAEVLSAEPTPGVMLRIAVSGGGCSGFQYGFTFDDTMQSDDRLYEREGARIVIDTMSLELMNGAEIDYVEDLVGAAFRISNPQASASCGCGNSFAL